MTEAVIGAIGTIFVGLFGIWWKNRTNKSKEESLGELRINNINHQKNAAGNAAADARLHEELPEGKDLIDALRSDARDADRD
jgi:hypothetical protein